MANNNNNALPDFPFSAINSRSTPKLSVANTTALVSAPLFCPPPPPPPPVSHHGSPLPSSPSPSSLRSRFRKMGSFLVSPIKSVCPCVSPYPSVDADDDSSPSSGRSPESSPDFIRTLLENNILFGQTI